MIIRNMKAKPYWFDFWVDAFCAEITVSRFITVCVDCITAKESQSMADYTGQRVQKEYIRGVNCT